MLYNLPTATDLIGLMAYIQFDIGIPLSQLIVMITFFVSFFALKRYETIRAFASSIFLTFIACLFLWLMGLLEDFWVLASAVSLALTVIFLYFRQEG